MFSEGEECIAGKEKIRALYGELQGYLGQCPDPLKQDIFWESESEVWEQVNRTVDELSQIIKKDLKHYKMIPQHHSCGEACLPVNIFRCKLGGLISRLHGEYFSDDPAPFSGAPPTVFSQIQQQNQSFQVELVFEMVSKIDEQLNKLKPNDKRRGFLEKVKGTLKSVRTATELIALYVATAKEFGLTLEELTGLFK